MGLAHPWLATGRLTGIQLYKTLSLRPPFGVGRGILNKDVMKCGGRRKSEDMTYTRQLHRPRRLTSEVT